MEQQDAEVTRLLAQPGRVAELVQNAQQLMNQQQDIAELYLEKLVEYYNSILVE